jgi:molybdopterin-guanine dinucleotide biosynthesis protein A
VSEASSIAGAILAGGQSRRMGEDKAFLTLAGTPMIRHAVNRLRPQVVQLILNVHEQTDALDNIGLPVVTDAAGDHQGPLSGILASLRWAEKAGIRWIATAAVDTPFFPKDLVQRLAAAAEDKSMAAARSGGRLHPVFGLWKADLAGALEDEIDKGLRSVHQWVALHDAGIADWQTEPYDPFFNINQPEDVTQAMHILSEFAP